MPANFVTWVHVLTQALTKESNEGLMMIFTRGLHSQELRHMTQLEVEINVTDFHSSLDHTM